MKLLDRPLALWERIVTTFCMVGCCVIALQLTAKYTVEQEPLLLWSVIDEAFPSLSVATIPYLVCYIGLFVGALLHVTDTKQFLQLVGNCTYVVLVSILSFIMLPTSTLRISSLDSSSIFDAPTILVYTFDPNTATAPALCASLGLTISLFLHNNKYPYIWAYCFTAITCISSLLIKQHTLFGIVSGLVLAGIVYKVLEYYYARPIPV